MPYATPHYCYPKGPFVLCHPGPIPFTPDLPPEGSSNSYQCQSQPLHSWTLKSQRNVPPCPRPLQGLEATIPTYPIVPNPYSLLSSIPLVAHITALDLRDIVFTVPLTHNHSSSLPIHIMFMVICSLKKVLKLFFKALWDLSWKGNVELESWVIV